MIGFMISGLLCKVLQQSSGMFSRLLSCVFLKNLLPSECLNAGLGRGGAFQEVLQRAGSLSVSFLGNEVANERLVSDALRVQDLSPRHQDQGT